MTAMPVLLLLGCAICLPSAAQPFCEGLKAVVAETKSSFVPLRGNFDFEGDEYKGIVQLGDLADCSTESVDGVGRYSCVMELPDDEGVALKKTTELVGMTKECLGVDVQRVADRGHKMSFKYRPTGDDISVRYQRLVSKRTGARFQVTLSVNVVDLSR
jgi:hypothetical protein